MGWIPDEIFYAMKAAKGGGGGGDGGCGAMGGGGGKGNWVPDEIFYAMKAAKGGGGGAAGGGSGGKSSGSNVAVKVQNQPKAKGKQAQTPPEKKQLPTDPSEMLAHMVNLFQQNFTGNVAASQTPWKGKLHETLKRNGIDDKPEYVATANTGGPALPDGGAGFLGTVTVNGQSFASDEVAKGKREAEQNAAKAALKALYPDQFNEVPQGDGGLGPLAMLGMAGGMSGKAQKRKEPPTDLPLKSKLMHSVQLMVRNKSGRTLTKQDIIYAITENEGPPKTFMSTCTITDYEGGKCFSGEWCDNKTKAENSAAEAAYNAMSDMRSALEEEHAAKKKAKNTIQLAALVEKTAAKKEAKKALEAQAAGAA